MTSRRSTALVLLLMASSAGRALAQNANEGAKTLADPPSVPPVAGPSTDPRPLSESLEGEAKRDYEQGRRLYENGDYVGALMHFESARKLSADARLSWNAAVCHRALHQYAKAITAMRHYLASNSNVISPAARASARNFLIAAEQLTTRFEVSSNVAGARVYADGDDLGLAPLSPDTRLDWGDHQIVVQKPGYTDYAQVVSVTSSAVLRVIALLRPEVHEGRIVVRANSGDLIALDGQPKAWGTWEGMLPSGVHVLQVTAVGFRAHTQRIVVADAQTRGFDVQLERAPKSAVPTWLWLTSGAAVAAGLVTAGALMLKPEDHKSPVPNTLGVAQLGLR